MKGVLLLFAIWLAGAFAAQVVSNVQFVNTPTRVLPGGSLLVTVKASLSKSTAQSTVLVLDKTSAGVNYFDYTDLAYKNFSSGSATFQGTLSNNLVVGTYTLTYRFINNNQNIGPDVIFKLDVTCSDGVFCNGEERYANGKCVSTSNPCDDKVACTDNICVESNQTCWFQPKGQNCPSSSATTCQPKCGNAQCGSDGCGGLCITKYTDSAGNCLSGSCSSGKCSSSSNLPGTCSNPIPLFGNTSLVPNSGGTLIVYGDSSTGVNSVGIVCADSVSNDVNDLFYQIVVAPGTPRVGFEILSFSTSGNPADLDTVIAMFKDCNTPILSNGYCNDDGNPPGGYGSRLFGTLDVGTYLLDISGYDPRNVGTFQLRIKYNRNGCVPVCDARACGSDGCGGTCGINPCPTGTTCSVAGQCVATPCTPKCGGAKCGPDGCGGSCGTCAAGQLCSSQLGRCFASSTCDSLRPICKKGTGCGPNRYCGSDCQCYSVDTPLLDLVVAPENLILGTTLFEWRNFQDPYACVFSENCVGGTGQRLLLRFPAQVINQSPLVGFDAGVPARNPYLFEWGQCHQHYHFKCFAQFALLNVDGSTAVAGLKKAFCIEDVVPYLLGPNIPSAGSTDCQKPGLSPGWSDIYTSDLDCQWLDITDDVAVPKGKWYILELCTNVCHLVPESTYTNNCRRMFIFIPVVPSTFVGTLMYSTVTPTSAKPQALVSQSGETMYLGQPIVRNDQGMVRASLCFSVAVGLLVYLLK